MRSCFSYLLWVFLILISCQSKPLPFDIVLAGYTVRFPSTAGEVCSRFPNARESLIAYLIEETPHIKLEWRFDGSIYEPRSQLYGVLMTLRNQPNKIDSIRAALEKHYNLSFTPLHKPQHLGKYEYYQPDSTLSVLDINDDIQLSIHRRMIWPIEGAAYTNDVIVAISYGLNAEKKERFAIKQGNILPPD